MQERRFFAGDNCSITGEELRHLNVLRLKVGDIIVLIGKHNQESIAEITSITKQVAEYRIIENRYTNTEPNIDITLFQAVMKGDKNDLVTQKAVEIGVRKIAFFTSENTVKGQINEERLQKIADEAVKQCRRTCRIDVKYAGDFNAVKSQLGGFDTALLASEHEKRLNILDAIKTAHSPHRVALIVGSEGGFTPSEVLSLGKQVQSVTLGRRILRAETAAIYALSVLASQLDI